MKKTLSTIFIIVFSISTSFANLKVELNDTIKINHYNLLSKDLSVGKSNFIVYGKKDNNSNATNLTFVEINVEKYIDQNIPAYKITQKWSEKDTLVHTSESIFNQKDLKSIYHKSWWKRNNQSTEIDFNKKKFKITGNDEKSNNRAEESIKIAFNDSSYINWHCDLILFGLLPYQEGVTFQINLLNPSFSPPKYEYYKVLGSEKLEGYDCWILNYELPNNMGYQRFWISKSERIVIKEEDSFRGSLRYKLKTKVVE